MMAAQQRGPTVWNRFRLSLENWSQPTPVRDPALLSPRTLEGHWRAIHRKLGSVNRCQAGFIFAALRENLRWKSSREEVQTSARA
jgi:hypothetical protein